MQRNGSGIKISTDSSYEDCHGFLFVYSLPTKTLWKNIEDVEKAVKNKKAKEKGFQAKYLEALKHLAERVGFEPTVHCCTLDFESSTFDHSDTSPQRYCASLPHLFPLVKGRGARFLAHCARYCTILAKWMLVRAYSVPKMRSPASPRPGTM